MNISASYTLKIPSPGLAVVMFEKPLPSGEPSGGGGSLSLPAGSGGNATANGINNGSALSVGVPTIAVLGAIFVGTLVLN